MEHGLHSFGVTLWPSKVITYNCDTLLLISSERFVQMLRQVLSTPPTRPSYFKKKKFFLYLVLAKLYQIIDLNYYDVFFGLPVNICLITRCLLSSCRYEERGTLDGI